MAELEPRDPAFNGPIRRKTSALFIFGRDVVHRKLLVMETMPNAISTLFATSANSVVTDDGLCLKNVDKIERIRCDREQRIEPAFQSWQISRYVRRDYFLICFKMHCRSKDKAIAQQFSAFLIELRLKAEELREAVSSLPENPEPSAFKVPLRIVSMDAASLIKSMLMADLAFSRLNHAALKNAMRLDEVHATTREFELTFADLKGYAVGAVQSTRTASELGVEAGVV